MKISLTLPSSANISFIVRDKNDEPIYTYNDEYMRYFVRNSISGGRCIVLGQYYQSITFGNVFF